MLFWSNVQLAAPAQPAQRDIVVAVALLLGLWRAAFEMLTKPLSMAAPPPYQCFSALIAAWSPAGFESQDLPARRPCRRT